MFQRKKDKLIPAGDYITEKEAADEEVDVMRRCETVDDVVKSKIFTLGEALETYDITLEQYVGYMMLQKKKHKVLADEKMLLAVIATFIALFDLTHLKLNSITKKIVEDMRKLSAVKYK